MIFGLLKDRFQTARLQAKYQRLIQERVLELIEQNGPSPVSEDPDSWKLLGTGSKHIDEKKASHSLEEIRHFTAHNPHARNVLRLLEVYVVGPGFGLTHSTMDCGKPVSDEDRQLVNDANRLWQSFLNANQKHFSYREHARRTWRDGECFLRLFETGQWPPQVRFIDPELIAGGKEHLDSQGILTEPHDVESPLAYLLIDPATGDVIDQISPDEILHTKHGVDANVKRGVSFFLSLIEPLSDFEKWMETELKARKLQSSIVLWRRVNGSPTAVSNFADGQATDVPSADDIRRERFRAGSIITTSQGTDIKFLQPNTNFDDAVSLGRSLLLCAAAGAGLPEFMLTSDASNANYSSTLVAEGPAVKMFAAEQDFFMREFDALWRMVISHAVERQLLPADVFDVVEPRWSTPNIVIRDRPKERLADVQLVDAQILSRAEVARRDGVEPSRMRHEINVEKAG